MTERRITDYQNGRERENDDCPQLSVINIKGQHYECDAMKGMHKTSLTHDGWPHSNTEAGAIWGDRKATKTQAVCR